MIMEKPDSSADGILGNKCNYTPIIFQPVGKNTKWFARTTEMPK
jgi:hypothetical protein